MYSAEARKIIYDRVCSEIAKAKSLRTICEENQGDGFPGLRTLMTWLNEDAAFQQQYARAREEQADYLAQEIVEIADAPVAEWDVDVGDEKQRNLAAAASRAEMERRRQQIEARKWVAAKLKPKAYGDKLTLDGDLNVKLPDDQLETRLAHLLGKAGVALPARGEGTPEGEA